MVDALLIATALIAAFLALLRTVLDHLQLRRKLREIEVQLEFTKNALKARGELANEIAHEIKNPITAILCSAEALDLLIGPKLDDLHRQTLGYIREYGANVLQLVSDFIDVSRAEAGKITARPSRVKISPLVRSICGLLESVAIRKEVKVNFLATSDDYYAWTDEKHLKQILFNLVHNAIKYTRQGGEVQIVVKSDFPNHSLRFYVKDNGIGIPEDRIPHVFDLYERCERDGLPPDAGTGLGLALCKALVELSGGIINVASQVNIGTVFEFTVPESREAGEPAREVDEPYMQIEKPLQGQSFLIIDGDRGAREAVGQLIEAWGGLVEKVASAAAAVEALSHSAYDAVMIDDGEDGLAAAEIARVVRSECAASGTIILATRNEPEAKELLNSRADRYLTKPLNGKRLLRSLLHSGRNQVTH